MKIKCEHINCDNDATERRVDADLLWMGFDTCGQHDLPDSHLLIDYTQTTTYREEPTMTKQQDYFGVCCMDCAMLIENGNLPEHLSDSEARAFATSFADRNKNLHWLVQESEAHLSSDACTTCGTTLLGDRHDIEGWDYIR